MTTPRYSVRPFSVGRFLFLALALFYEASVAPCLAQKAQAKRTSQDPLDQAACLSQLNRIFSAIQQYQKSHQKLPGKLSDLRPAFIRDPDLLVCPFVLKTGQLKEWRRKYFDGVWADQYSSYAYEFILESAHFYPAATYRYFKQRQMELLGFSVPIVRCFAHRPVLNLAFDGNIYESPDTWEEIFVRSKDQESFFHGYVRPTTSQNQMIRKIIAQQPPELAAGALDLIGSYNALVLHLSEVDNQGKLLIKSPEGVLRIGGVEFDIRGLVHLTGKDFPINFPQKVENIPVNRKCAQIHFLHGAMFSAPAGSKVASYVVRFSNGHSEEVPIVYGKDVKTRWFDARQKSELENPRPAWVTPPQDVEPGGNALRLYVKTWDNPNPNLELRSIDYLSQMSLSAPFTVAITVGEQ